MTEGLLGVLQNELASLGLTPEAKKDLETQIAQQGIQNLNWRWKIPRTNYMVLVRYENHYIRCVRRKAWHLNVQLRDYVNNVDIFNIHIGAGRHLNGRITVFLFNGSSTFEICKQIPTVSDLKKAVREFLDQFLASAGISLPAVVVATIAAIIVYILLLASLPVLV